MMYHRITFSPYMTALVRENATVPEAFIYGFCKGYEPSTKERGLDPPEMEDFKVDVVFMIGSEPVTPAQYGGFQLLYEKFGPHVVAEMLRLMPKFADVPEAELCAMVKAEFKKKAK